VFKLGDSDGEPKMPDNQNKSHDWPELCDRFAAEDSPFAKGYSAMGFLGYLKDLATVACIGSLIVVGVAIALRSGIVAVGPDRSKQVLSNLSQLVVTLASCLVVFGIVQQFIGIRMPSPW
jgi:hypothetical protein